MTYLLTGTATLLTIVLGVNLFLCWRFVKVGHEMEDGFEIGMYLIGCLLIVCMLLVFNIIELWSRL